MQMDGYEKNKIIEELINELNTVLELSIKAGLCEHFVSDVKHLMSVAEANKETTKEIATQG